MKKIFIISFFVISLSYQNILFSQIKSEIVLKVENEIITSFDIKNKILSSLIISNQEINQENIDKYKKLVLNSLIDDKLKKIEVNRYNIKIDKIKINNYLSSISPNIVSLKQEFLNNNIDFEIFVDEISTDLKWKELIFQLYSKKIEIDKNNIEIEINEMLKKRSNIKEYKISKLEISSYNTLEDQKKIKEIKKEILEDGFEKVVQKYNEISSSSDQGDLGWLNSKSLSEDVYKIISKMQIGKISPPIKKQNSIIFLKLIETREFKPEKLDMNKLKMNFINRKKNEQFNLYSKSHISKLRNTSTIEYK